MLSVFADTIGSGTDLRRTRWFLEASSKLLRPPRQVRVRPTTAGHVPGEWVFRGDARDDQAILYLHGGGFVEGSVNTHREIAARVALASGARVLLIDYRLAPEHPYPGALEDCIESYRWLLTQGFESGHIGIVGDSAGGGLAISTLVLLRDSGAPLPAAAVCVSPWVDLALEGDTVAKYERSDPMVRTDFLRFAARQYLAGQAPRSPLASPTTISTAASSPYSQSTTVAHSMKLPSKCP